MVSSRLAGALRFGRAALIASSTLALITCAEDPVGPATGEARLRIVPTFANALVPPLTIDAVHVGVSRPDPANETSISVFDDTVAFSPDANTLTLRDIRIQLSDQSEDLDVILELLAGTTVMFVGRQSVTVVRGQTTRPASIVLNYAGPGANVARLQLAPRDTTIVPGAVVDFRLDAFDNAGAPVPQYYASWSLTGGPAAGARINAAGRLTAPGVADTFFVKAVNIPTNSADSTRVIVAPAGPPPPTAVIPTPIAAGDSHTCEIRGTTTYCWGDNRIGQLGDGSTTPRLIPTPVAGGHVFVALAAGLFHTCGLTAQGQAFCWGENSSGGLGDGTTTARSTPVAVLGGFTFAQLAAGDGYTCGITLTGQGRCWGANFTGSLGNGTTTSSSTPVLVAGGHTFVRVSAAGQFDNNANHTCAIDAGALGWCWGANSLGQLGDGTTTQSLVPVAVTGGHLFGEIAAGAVSGCGVTTAGELYCWGPILGLQGGTPQLIGGGFTYSAIDAGDSHLCARTAAGWRCAGGNSAGQLGDGSGTTQNTPVLTSGGLNFTNIAAGTRHTCGITATGTYCWGSNSQGQLGTGDPGLSNSLVPVKVVGSPASVAIGQGNNQSAPAGTAVAVPPSVLVRDGSGTPLPGVEVIWTITAGGGTVDGNVTLSTLTDNTGVAVTGVWQLGATPGTNTMTATASAAGVSGNPVSFTATGTAVITPVVSWTGGTSTDWSLAANWTPARVPTFADSVVIGATAQFQPTLTADVVTGAVSIVTGGRLTIGGHGLGTTRGLSTSGTGVLVMQNANDVVSVVGNAVFDGGNELNLLSAGGLSIGGNLTQRATTSGDSYHPSGTHITLFSGANPSISFATPGLVPGTSHFQDLAWAGGTMNLLTPVMAHGTFTITAQTASTIVGTAGSRLTVGELLKASPLVLNGAPLTISQTVSGSLTLSDLTFQNQPTNVGQLVVSHPGTGGTASFTNIAFSTTPVAPNGFYLDAVDVNGPTDGALTIDMVTPNPVTPGAFLRTTGGAVVRWPVTQGRTWTGTLSSAWSAGGNWSGGVAPTAVDSVVIPAATNPPILDVPVSVAAVNVTGGILSLGGQSLTTNRGFSTTGTGRVTSPAGSILFVGGNATFSGGDQTGLLLAGELRVSGNFTQTGLATSFVAGGTHTVAFVGIGAQTISMADGVNSAFQNIDITNNVGAVTLGTNQSLTVKGTLSLVAGTNLTGSGFVTAGGVNGVTGSRLGVSQLTVPASNLAVLGTYAVAQTILTGGGVLRPASYTNLQLEAGPQYSLGANLGVSGNLTILGDLAVSGRTVAVGGDLATAGTGVLTMVNGADLVTVAGATSFSGGDETGKLTAGILRTSNQFLQDATTSPTSFLASGTHTVEIVSQNPFGGVVSFATPTASHFQNLRLLFLSSLTSDIEVAGSLEVNFNAAGNLFARRVRVGGNFTKDGIGFFGPTRLTLLGGSTVLAETVGPDTLEFLGAAPQTFPPSTFPGTVLIANDVTAPAGFVGITKDLAIQNGGIFRLGTVGSNFSVGGNMSTAGTGRLEMIDPTAALIVSGNATFAGGSTAGLLTAGTLSIGGNFTQSAVVSTTSYAPSGTHKTLFTTTVSRTVSMGSPGAGAGGSHFQVLDVSAATGGLTLDVNLQADSIISTSAAAKISSPGVTLTVRRAQVAGLQLVNTTFSLDELTSFSTENFSNVTFSGFPTTGTTMFKVSGPGSAVAARPPLTTTNVNFQTLPVGAGNFYVDLTSNNGFSVNLNMTTSNQATNSGGNGAALTKVTPATGVATVTW